ncbi:MAG: EAL domain-containing protein [Pseudomonadota bacterium]|jgi:diguanylate cyclase (GGDEF)-like protein/PAS domain S-box-containing protein|nr:EAL domain-containing protein [Xanthomonadaceae bacterium]MDE2249642.1 EAL domain-containing protein [Xanthomonadaceae bacterium]MDE3211160.1 EAL domain-containing protein [Pseudomonadota bacterium]
MPLAYALVAVVGVIVLLTWFALKSQVTLAGFLNSESVWSKAQKQAVIALQAYAISGKEEDLRAFESNYAVLDSDRRARDQISSGHFDRAVVDEAFVRGSVMPSAQSGMVLVLQHLSGAPHLKAALVAWRSTDHAVAELAGIAHDLGRLHASGPIPPELISQQLDRIQRLNDEIEPRANQFSVDIALGASWMGQVLFIGVFGAASVALLLWLGMARRILASVRGSEERYRLLFDSAGDAIVMVDETSGRILDANRTALSWTGRSAADLIGDRFVHLFTQPLAGQVDGKATANALLGADGGVRPVETQSNVASWGALPVRQAIIRDISERVAMEQERRVAAEALASIAEGVIIADAERRVISTNAAQTELTGFTQGALQGRRLEETRCLPDGRVLPRSVWDGIAAGRNWIGEVQSTRSDGSHYPEQLSISAIRDADNLVVYYVAVFTNIHETKRQQRRLEHLARHDPLTGLANRAEFERRCADAIAVAERERLAVVVLFIDLDAFKIVNDSYSHAVGDRLLAKVAERIRNQLSDGDVAGRIGGDEFTVLLSRQGLREDARPLVGRLLAALAEPLVVDDYEVVLSASIGVAGYPLDGDSPQSLIANADAAMYAAKMEERNTFRFYTPMMHADTRRRLQMAAELRQALARDEFRLVFQPSVEMRTGRIVAVEALLRWQHPEHGEVMPGDFIPVAEGMGMIRRIDEWVMQAACAQIQAWDAAGVPPIRVAVNISARWFGHPAFVDGVSLALGMRQLPAQRLLLEITESAMLRLGDATARTMQTLATMGIEVAIDDFGTGYSSMAYLKLPAVAYLKIDRSFITGLPASANDAAITEAMLVMAKSLGLFTIAEGIETEAQHEFLLRAGCNEGQGYLYSYPLRPDEIQRLLSPSQQVVPTRLRLVPPKRR